jgi:hypothetical protein
MGRVSGEPRMNKPKSNEFDWKSHFDQIKNELDSYLDTIEGPVNVKRFQSKVRNAYYRMVSNVDDEYSYPSHGDNFIQLTDEYMSYFRNKLKNLVQKYGKLTESDLVRIVKRVIKEQSEVKVDMPTIQKLFKEKGYKFEPQSGYSLYAHKETDGPIQDRKTGNYYWNYETYIPTKPGNQLWIDRRRGDGKSGTESENIIINLNGPEHSIQHRQNGKLIKQEKLNTQSVLDMINNYVAKF